MSARGARLILAAGALAGLVMTVWMSDRSVPQPEQVMRSEPPVQAAEEESASAVHGRAGPSPESGDLAGPALQGLGWTSTGIRGRVVDAASGAGIAGARVRLSSHGEEALVVDVESDADGSFTFDVDDARTLTLSAWHAAYGVHKSITLDDVPPEGLRIELTRGEVISGRVVDAVGGPMAKIRVRIEQNGEVFSGDSWTIDDEDAEPAFPFETITDEGGHFELAAQPPDEVSWFVAPRHPGWVARWTRVPLAGSEEARRELVLALTRGATLSGRVSMDRLGAVAGCKLSAGTALWYGHDEEADVLPWSHDPLLCESDENGRFLVRGVPPEPARLDVWPTSTWSWSEPFEWRSSSLASNQIVDDIEIVLPFDVEIAVTLVGPDEAPLRGEQLTLLAEQDDPAAAEWGTTDEEGRVYVKPQHPRGLRLVRRTASGYDVLREEIDPLVAELRIHTTPADIRWLFVECVPEPGVEAPSSFHVSATRPGDGGSATASVLSETWTHVSARSVGGRAGLPILGPLPITVTAISERAGRSDPVVLEAWPENSTIRLHLQRDHVIHARIVDGRGHPVGGLIVRLVPVNSREQALTTSTDADGWFSAIGASQSDWYHVRPELGTDLETVGAWSLFPSLPDPTLHVVRLGRLEGRLVGVHAQQLAGLEVSGAWEASDGERRATTTTDELGRFTLDGLPVADDSLLVVDEAMLAERGLSTAHAALVVRAGADPVEVPIVRRRSLEGVVRADAPTLASVEIEVWPHDPFTVEPVRADVRPDGSFDVSAPGEGPWTVAAFVRTGVESGDENDSRLLADARVVRGSDGHVDLVVPPSSEVTVGLDGLGEMAWLQAWSGDRLISTRIFELDVGIAYQLPVLAARPTYVTVVADNACAVGLRPREATGGRIEARTTGAVPIGGELRGRRLSPTARLAARTAHGRVAAHLYDEQGWFAGDVPVGRFDLVLTEYFTEEQVLAEGLDSSSATEELVLTVR